MNALLIFTLALLAVASARPKDEYTDRYDNINIDEVLTNQRLMEAYLNCALDKGRCSAEGKELKSHIKEALETYCEKCTETQRTKTRQVIGHLINKETDYWNQLVAKYDPTHKYTSKYESELRTLKGQ